MTVSTLNSSSVVESTWRKRHKAEAAKKSFLSSAFILAALCIIYIDVNYKAVSNFLDIDHWLLIVLENVVGLVLLVRICFITVALISYALTCMTSCPIDITSQQQSLLAVKQNESGFRIIPLEQKTDSEKLETSLVFSTCNGSFLSGETSPGAYAPRRGVLTPVSQSPMHRSLNYSPSQSPFSGSFGSSFEQNSFNSSAPSPVLQAYEDRTLRYKPACSSPKSGTGGSPFDYIRDQATLNSFLQEERGKEERSRQAGQENTVVVTSPFWSYGNSAVELAGILRNYVYQIATRLPLPYSASSSAGDASTSGCGRVWHIYDVGEDELCQWTERLRKWINATIVNKLSLRIDKVNSQLQRIGCDDTQIGDVSVATLRQLALVKSGLVPSLTSLVHYLDCCTDQHYLVRRIKDLNTGSMSEFTWNKGGNYDKQWAEHLISDASLVVHLLCAYLDARLPAQPPHLDGRMFTARHFVKAPDKPDMSCKDNLILFQTDISPPHFQVVIGTDVYNLPKGRNNFFHAVLLFFYLIKVRQCGMLGHINMGLSGLNIMWIFQKD